MLPGRLDCHHVDFYQVFKRFHVGCCNVLLTFGEVDELKAYVERFTDQSRDLLGDDVDVKMILLVELFRAVAVRMKESPSFNTVKVFEGRDGSFLVELLALLHKEWYLEIIGFSLLDLLVLRFLELKRRAKNHDTLADIMKTVLGKEREIKLSGVKQNIIG